MMKEKLIGNFNRFGDENPEILTKLDKFFYSALDYLLDN